MNSLTPSRIDVVDEARRWIGTPYKHQGRRRGIACDCIGLIVGVGRALDLTVLPDHKLPFYTRWPHNHVAERTASTVLTTVKATRVEDAKPGQIGLFYWRSRDHGQHFCIFGEHEGRPTMIHAYFGCERVVECGVAGFWRKRLLRIYDYKEIADAS